MTNLCVIIVNYVKPLEEVDKQIEAHKVFLKKYADQNVFLASGRRVPRTGGIILAAKKNREQVLEIVKEDPFHQHGLAKYEVLEFEVARSIPKVAALLAEIGT